MEIIDSRFFSISQLNYSMATKVPVLEEIGKSKFIYSNNQNRYHLYENDMEKPNKQAFQLLFSSLTIIPNKWY